LSTSNYFKSKLIPYLDKTPIKSSAQNRNEVDESRCRRRYPLL